MVAVAAAACLLLLGSASSGAAAHPKDPCAKQAFPSECEALVAVGKALNYKKWKSNKGWMGTGSVCKWAGVTCGAGAGSADHVTELDLSHFGIDGFIHGAIGNLTHLEKFDISGHRPKPYEAVCAEQKLHRSGFPASFWTLTNLKIIDVEYTCVGGPIPELIGNLVNLEVIEFHGNYLNGTIPQSVMLLTNLLTFKFGRNPFTGGFPNVANLHKLQQLSANFCSLTGTVPDIFNNFPDLEIMYMDGNGFTGSLPPSLASCSKLWSFSFNINNMTGPVPPSYCSLPLLTDCRIGADLNLTEYEAHYPWLQKVEGNVWDCPMPVCATHNNVCDRTKPCGPNGAWTNHSIGPCSPTKCQ